MNEREAVANHPAGRGQGRVTSIDALRGIAMVVMALDHTREFLTNVKFDALDPAQTNRALFFTRWSTHLCAPIFVFLAGTAIYLQQRRKTSLQITRHLLARGLWLVLLELTAVNLIFNFTWHWNVQLLEVIWAIGASMMLMAGVIHLKRPWILILATVMIAGHNALDTVQASTFGQMGWVWQLLHSPGLLALPFWKSAVIVVAYPVVPWIAVMALGYWFGPVVVAPRERAAQLTFRGGAAMIIVFLGLRWSNVYGNPLPWTRQQDAWHTVFSFLNVQKYPPSLLFLLITLGLAAVLLGVLLRAEKSQKIAGIRRWLEVYGRVPLFYFLLHLTLICS